MPGTVRLHRVLTAKPEKVYRAFLEPLALAKWLPPQGFTCSVQALDARVGGTFSDSVAGVLACGSFESPAPGRPSAPWPTPSAAFEAAVPVPGVSKEFVASDTRAVPTV